MAAEETLFDSLREAIEDLYRCGGSWSPGESMTARDEALSLVGQIESAHEIAYQASGESA